MAQISPLRQRMIEDLTIRNLSPETQRSYVHHVAKFSRFFGRSPDQLGYEEVRAYQAHLVGRRVLVGCVEPDRLRLAFFYGVVSDPLRQIRSTQRHKYIRYFQIRAHGARLSRAP
ncbi:phage integrase N-terminal SAM-like domain-containing protein [Mesorhizobium australicum]|uniref:phage integrase N-terminal SAM-like domain-containing protein n=1 Tax=Mesorhizobium australicum TaxID=536018 RepID=UPI00333CF17B